MTASAGLRLNSLARLSSPSPPPPALLPPRTPPSLLAVVHVLRVLVSVAGVEPVYGDERRTRIHLTRDTDTLPTPTPPHERTRTTSPREFILAAHRYGAHKSILELSQWQRIVERAAQVL
ncbi:hypothetical protein DAEQUDRAFT_133023 [Daedalea quercina L-15889]|uniref:Uncharacterized protein n=1 Tax=Daedalea quercina L-15889 TaxID=1314783 RepID=A0A165KQ30_9APHY|nr:hypothetical protein DAEQUDRAFT_133023 [Daedalea quercina L-15889]